MKTKTSLLATLVVTISLGVSLLATPTGEVHEFTCVNRNVVTTANKSAASNNTTAKKTTSNTTVKKTTTNNTTVKKTTSNNTVKAQTNVDKRKPNYKATNPNYKKYKYSWTTEKGNRASFELNIDINAYKHYSSLDRYYDASTYTSTYLSDSLNKEYAKAIAKNLRTIQKQAGWSDWTVVAEAVNFVQQNISYQYDIDGKGQKEYPKYIIETLVDRKGDCEDSAMLLAEIIRELGYTSALIHLPGHVAVGLYSTSKIAGGSYYTVNGLKYYYIETTNTGWEIGSMPAKYKTETAKIYKLK